MDVVLICLLVIAIDQITKYLIQLNMNPYDSMPVIKNIFHITYVQNTGAAFSILKGKTFFFSAVSIAIILAIIVILLKHPIQKKLLRGAMGLILGGAIGNLIDRIRFGYVVDFIDFRVWPVFNIADCAIVVGVLVLAYLITFDPELETLFKK